MAAMAPLTLSQLLDVAIGTSCDGAVDLPSLHRLLQSMLGHLGLQDLPVLEPGHRPTALLGGHQATKDQPGLEKEEDRAQGTGQQPREPEEHLPGKELLQGTASGSQVTSLANSRSSWRRRCRKQRLVRRLGSRSSCWRISRACPATSPSACWCLARSRQMSASTRLCRRAAGTSTPSPPRCSTACSRTHPAPRGHSSPSLGSTASSG
nr:uncharacterized protein LOC110360734 isoform X2 [Columba livia]